MMRTTDLTRWHELYRVGWGEAPPQWLAQLPTKRAFQAFESEHEGQLIAMRLTWARQAGFRRVVTQNAELRPGILALNLALGFEVERTETIRGRVQHFLFYEL